MRAICLLAVATFATAFTPQAAPAAVTLSESFGTLPDGNLFTSATGTRDGSIGTGTGNTAFTYVHASTDPGSLLEAQSPGSFAGSSALVLSTGSSLAGVGSSGLASFTRATLSFSLLLPSSFSGASDTFFFGLGSGGTFSGNSPYTGTDLAFGFQISNGILQEIQGNTNSPFTPIALAAGQRYNITLQANNGAALTDNMGIVNFPSGYSKLYLSGTQVSGTYRSRPIVNMTGVRLYSVNGLATAGGYELDNVLLQDIIAPVPEPAATTLGVLGLLGFVVLAGRCRHRAAAGCR